MDRQDLINKFFKRTELYWIRRRDGYRFNNEEMNLAIDHYIYTKEEP